MLKRIAKDFIIFGFAAYGVIWTLIASSEHFLNFHLNGWKKYGCMILVSCIIGAWRSWPKKSIEIKVPNSNSSIIIEFGDLFKHDGYIAIPVNEYFDGELGNHVSPNSLHGMFIKYVLGGQSSAFDTLITSALAGKSFSQENRPTGKQNKYRIGTTAVIEINSKKYFLFALAHTDISTLKAHATIHDLWDAMAGLWEEVRVNSNGYVVAVPLAGGGLSGVGLPPKNLLDVIVMSFFYYTKKNRVADRVKVILPQGLRREIDLLSYLRNWSE